MLENLATYLVREPRDSDSKALISLVKGCFEEYEGVYLEPDGLDADLKAYATALRDMSGKGYVLETEEKNIVGLVSGGPTDAEDTYQLKRLYLQADHRGGGTASNLLRLIEQDALAQKNVIFLVLWSDVKFERAHRFYEREGFEKTGKTRELNDISGTVEYEFRKKLR